MAIINSYINEPSDLVTSLEETRAGFLDFALEKNRKSTPYIERAKVLKIEALKAESPKDLLDNHDIYPALLSAAGLSNKSLQYFTFDDKQDAILALIENFLEPSGEYFIDELVYRYLLMRGDSFGGSMRNLIGRLGEQKFIRKLLAVFSVYGISYQWLKNGDRSFTWNDQPSDETIVETDSKAIAWTFNDNDYILAFNLNIPKVRKNIDLCLFEGQTSDYNNGEIVNNNESILMLGEIKGGIDPAGADERWKTANSALNRIRDAYDGFQDMKTSIISAAITLSGAEEIYAQLENEVLTNAANLTNDNQLTEFCNWLTNIRSD